MCRLAGLAFTFSLGVLLQLLVSTDAFPVALAQRATVLRFHGPCDIMCLKLYSALQGCILWHNWWPLLTGEGT